MKKLWALLILLSAAITAGCKTTKTEKKGVTLPPKPQRQEIPFPEELKDYALIIVYYDSLVQQWETWAETVENILYEKEEQQK